MQFEKNQNKLVHELKTAARFYGANALHSCCLAQFNLINSNFYETLSKRRKIINPNKWDKRMATNIKCECSQQNVIKTRVVITIIQMTANNYKITALALSRIN